LRLVASQDCEKDKKAFTSRSKFTRAEGFLAATNMDMAATFLTQDATASEEMLRKDKVLEDEIAELQGVLAGVTQMSQSTLLLQKRKEMIKVDNELEEMKKQYEQRMSLCYKKQKEFEVKKKKLDNQEQKFKRFIQENNHKKQVAMNKQKTERGQKEQKEIELQEKMRDQEELKREKERLKEAHANLFKYQKYLEATVEVSAEQYEEVEDILNRHKTLATTQADLKDSLAKEAVGLESLRGDLNALKRATQNTILVHNSEIHRNQKKIEALRSQSAQMDTQREKEERSTFLKLREYGQVMMSIKNLHQRCLAKRHKRTAQRLPMGAPQSAVLKDLKDKLIYIQNRMVMLQEIRSGYETYKEEKAAEKKIQDMREAGKEEAAKKPAERERTNPWPRFDAGTGLTRAWVIPRIKLVFFTRIFALVNSERTRIDRLQSYE